MKKAAGPMSPTVVPCEVVEPPRSPKIEKTLSLIETEYSVTLAICLTHANLKKCSSFYGDSQLKASSLTCPLSSPGVRNEVSDSDSFPVTRKEID